MTDSKRIRLWRKIGFAIGGIFAAPILVKVMAAFFGVQISPDVAGFVVLTCTLAAPFAAMAGWWLENEIWGYGDDD